MTTILILGSGYHGWNIALHLITKGTFEKVVCVDNFSKQDIMKDVLENKLKNQVPVSQRVEMLNYHTRKHNAVFEFGDITNNDFIKKMFTNYNPDIVINCAKQYSSNFCNSNDEANIYTLQNNVIGLVTLLSNINKKEIALINVNSIYNPADMIGLHNFTEKVYLQHFALKNKITIANVFCGDLYGMKLKNINDKNIFASVDYDNIFGSFTNKLMTQFLLHKKIFIYGNEKRRIPILYLQDFVNGITKIILMAKKKNGYFAVGLYSEFITLGNIIEKIKNEDSFIKYIHDKNKDLYEIDIPNQINLKMTKFDDVHKLVSEDFKKVMQI